jgi:hypothetical protein
MAWLQPHSSSLQHGSSCAAWLFGLGMLHGIQVLNSMHHCCMGPTAIVTLQQAWLGLTLTWRCLMVSLQYAGIQEL